MVPKDNLVRNQRIPQENNTEMEEARDSEDDDIGSGYESDNESGDFDGGDDFLNAVNKLESSRKRKFNKVEEEEDVADDNETPEVNDNVLPKKKKKKKKLNLGDIKPPTAEEMIRLRDTENLFHSNLFRLQIEEIIKEVKPKKAERNEIKPWIEEMKEFLLNIDDSEIPSNGSLLPKDIKSPLPRLPREEIKTETRFQKPQSVSVVGSYGARCCMGPALAIDLAVVIPKKYFLKEDYLNARYHRKRALYLCWLAHGLRKSGLIDQKEGVRWTWSGSSPLSPQLMVVPVGKVNEVKVYISAVPQAGSFKLSRFTPNKNNVRESWLSKGQIEDCRTSTPIYNTSVMRDLVQTPNETVRSQALEGQNNLKDAIILLRVWLRQRNLDSGCGGFTGYLASMLVVALLLSRRLNSLMSSYQIIRNIWLVLSQSDWTKEGFTMCSTKQEENTPSLQDFHSHFDVVFVDSTGYCNLAADVHRLTYFRLRQEAKLAVQWLDNPDMNSFQALFMVPLPFLREFDHVICLKKKAKTVTDVLSKNSTEEQRTNHFVSQHALFTDIVIRLLQRALGGRVEQLVHQLSPLPLWPVTEKRPKPDQNLLIGLRLNAETAFSVVEKGPPANEPQAAEFRELWGSRCELRRFRDGTVCEAVVWADPDSPLQKRRLITKKVVKTILRERLSLPSHFVTYLADQLEPFVVEKAVIPVGFKYGSGEEASHAVTQAFDRLVKQLRDLPDMPLDVSSIQGVSAVFRGTDVFPPLARTVTSQAKTGMKGKTCWILRDSFGMAPDFIAPVEGVLQLGLSRKWPEDLDAVRRIRAAFNIHIAKALREKFDLQTQAFADHVDVFKDGFVFRIRIVYPREVVLLKESISPDGKLSYRETPESNQLEKSSLHLPKLTGALHGLQQQWPSFSVTSRLAKRWLSSQLLDNSLMPDVATELLVASLFLSPQPFCPLSQAQPMFLRFLNLLLHTNWHLEHVIVNFNGDMKRDDLVEIESHFRNERASLPPMFIATQYDRISSVWTKEAPILPVLARMGSVAKEALTILETTFLRSALLEECKVVFRPPLEMYDALIHLKPVKLPRIIHGVDHIKKDPTQLTLSQDRVKIPITDFDPAQLYLQELRGSYSEFALFFHDTYGGKTIGVLFRPSTFEKQDFKVSHMNGRRPVNEEEKIILKLNFDAIIEDFYVLGAGLVRTIDLNPKYSEKL